MRMLFLTTRLPFPPVGGERVRPFYFLKYLSQSWEITLLSFIESESEKEVLKDYNLNHLRMRTVTLPRNKSYVKCLKGFFDENPLEIAYYTSKAMRQIVEEEVRSEKYNLFFCHLLRMAPYVADYYGVKKVLDMSDALSLRYALSFRFRQDPFRFIELLESRRLKKFEPKISDKFDLNLISSSIDKIYLEQKLGVKKLEVLENGVDLGVKELGENRVNTKKIVFFANLRTFHNVDAVKYFYKKIFPLIKKKIKDAKFTVVGTSIPKCILSMGKDESVSIYKDIPDICSNVSDACVSVAPMRIAVGIQNKIIQSMAFKIPVVTTTLGLGGIGAQPDKEILVADTPKEFADKVIMLMKDANLRNNISESAYNLIKERYLWQDIVTGLSKKLMNLLGKENA